MRKLLNGIYLSCGIVAAILLVLICGVIFVQTVFNFIIKIHQLFTGTGLDLSIPDYKTIVGYMLAVASFFALPYTFQKGGHIRMTLLHHAVGSRVRYIFDIACVFAAGITAGYLTYDLALSAIENFTFGETSSGTLKIDEWIPLSLLTAGCAVLTLSLIDALVELIATGRASFEKSEDNTLESSHSS